MAVQADNFDGTLSNWTIIAGSWSTSSGKAVLSASEGRCRYSNTSLASNNYFSEVEWDFANVVNNQGGGAAARINTGGADTFYVAEWRFQSGGNKRYLSKFVNGTRTIFHTSDQNMSTGDLQRVICNGTTISAQWNGSQYASVTDSAIASGAAGMYGVAPSGGRFIRFERWNAADLAAPPTVRTLSMPITISSVTPAVDSILDRNLSMIFLSQISATPSVDALLERGLSAPFTIDSTTPAIDAVLLRGLSMSLTMDSSTPSVDSILDRELSLSMALASFTPDIDIDLSGSRLLAMPITISSVTPAVDSILDRNLSMVFLSQISATPVVDITLTRSLSAPFTISSTTPAIDAVLEGSQTGIWVRTVQMAARTTVGTQDFTVPGVGTPKGYLAFATFGVSNGSVVPHAMLAIGAGDGTRQWACHGITEHGQILSDSYRWGTRDASIIIPDLDGLVEGKANFVSFIPDGIQFNWGQAPTSAVLVTIVLFGGDNLSVYAADDSHTGAQDASQSYNAPGFEPDLLIVSGNTSDFDNTGTNDYRINLGFSSNTNPIRQGCVFVMDDSSISPTESFVHAHNNRVYESEYDTGSRSLEVTAYGASGFDLTKRGTSIARFFGYLALNMGGTVGVDVRAFTSPISPGNFSRTDFGFKPQFVMIIPSFVDTLNSILTTEAAGAGSHAVAVGDATNQYCMSIATEDDQPTSDTQSLTDNQLINVARGDGSQVFDASLSTFDAAGYTLNFAVTDGTARHWFELGIEEDTAPVVGPHVGSLSTTGVGR